MALTGGSGVPCKRPASASDVPPADLAFGFHATRQSLSTCKKTPRVITSVPSSSRRSKRRCFQQRRPLARFSGKLYRVPDGACAGTGLLPSSGRSQIALKCCLRPYDGFTYPPSIKRLAASSERNRARFRRAHSREFGFHAASGHTPGTARKGWSFSRVPSLVFGCLRRMRFAPASRTASTLYTHGGLILSHGLGRIITRFTGFTRLRLICL
jgi:hypothetical protein